MATAVILPVKAFDRAKQRLGDRFPGPERAALARAMAEDVLDVLERAALGPLVVVSAEAGLAGAAGGSDVAGGSATVVADEREEGQSAAALLGLGRARELGCDRALLVPGDCPLIDGGELRELLARASDLDVAIVPDRHGTGTNALVLDVSGAFVPQFGPGSCARHVEQAREKGLSHEMVAVPSLQLDIDTRDDAAALESALARYPDRAPRTRAALAHVAA